MLVTKSRGKGGEIDGRRRGIVISCMFDMKVFLKQA